jgi:hypothetical protein
MNHLLLLQNLYLHFRHFLLNHLLNFLLLLLLLKRMVSKM